MVTDAISEAKGNSAKKVTLKVEAETEAPFNGPIRIVGRAKDNVNLEMIATAGTRAEGHRTSSLWLTR